MKGDSIPLLDLLAEKHGRFIIPVYQRNYDWQQKQCKQLFDDLEQVVINKRKSHFFGSIVSAQVSDEDPHYHLIIDGQQRITTVSLLLAAMIAKANELSKHNPPESFFSNSGKIAEIKDHLIDPHSDEVRKLRLKPVKEDCNAYDRLFKENAELINNSTITANYLYFYDRLSTSKVGPDDLFNAIEKLQIIIIRLGKDDDPQLIFESLNSTGLDLTEGDKIRNFILMGLDAEIQEKYYEKYWNPIENATHNQVSEFIRHYLTLIQRKIPTISNVYGVFKEYVINQYSENGNVNIEPVIENMLYYAKLYANIIEANTKSMVANAILARLNQIEMSVTFPFLLALLGRWNKDEISQNDVDEVLACVESFILRRFMCEKPTNALNKIFCSLDFDVMRVKGNAPYGKVLIYILEAKTGTSAFPNNTEFRKAIRERNVYNFNKKNRGYLFDRLENGDTRERVNVIQMLEEQKLTVEHIMPQTLSEKWKQQLGEDWKDLFENRLHTLANLTLTGYNSKYGNHPYEEKKTVKDGFNDSPLKLNNLLKSYTKWTREEMDARQKWITERMLELWAYPKTDFEPPKQEYDEMSLENGADLTGRKLISYAYGDAYVKNTDQWVDMFTDMVQLLYDENPSIMRNFAADKNFVDISFNPNGKQSDWYKVAADIYVYKANSTSAKMRILNRIFVDYDKDPADLVFTLKPEINKEKDEV